MFLQLLRKYLPSIQNQEIFRITNFRLQSFRKIRSAERKREVVICFMRVVIRTNLQVTIEIVHERGLSKRRIDHQVCTNRQFHTALSYDM